MDMDIIAQSILGILPFLYHLGAGLLLMVAFIIIYVKITPYPELDLIRSGNVAAAAGQAAAALQAVPVGDVKTEDQRLEKDPDRRVQQAIALVREVRARSDADQPLVTISAYATG